MESTRVNDIYHQILVNTDEQYNSKKQNDILRQQDNFQASKKNFRKNKGGQWDAMKEVRVKFGITCF